MSHGRLPRILHISGDFPDPIEPSKTPVIARLLALTDDQFEHRIISLNRVSPSIGDWASGTVFSKQSSQALAKQQAFERGVAVQYYAPAKGVLHKAALERLGDWIAEFARSDGQPDLIIGHKLTIEGIAAMRAAKALGVPFALSIQGNTDTKILVARPDLKRVFGRAFHEAAAVFPFAPWALDEATKRLGARTKPTVTLPCATDLDQIIAPKPGGNGMVSLFHLGRHKTKNLAGLGAAMRRLQNQPNIPVLNVIGDGTDPELVECRKTANAASIHYSVPPMRRSDLGKILNEATGFVMPSLAESFGLVFTEALFAGLPIIYPKGRAVDGYFDDLPFAIAVNPKDPANIAEAITYMCRHEAALKAELALWQNSDHARQFTQNAIAQQFASG
ncbi:MAG: glycosyltransferase family 4 protein, partial [Marinomonas sp.]